MHVSSKIKNFFSTAIMVYALASPISAQAGDVGNASKMRPIETRPAIMAAMEVSKDNNISASLQTAHQADLKHIQNRFHFKIENLTEHSKNIKTLQSRFENAIKDRPIIFLDYDEIALDSYIRALKDPNLANTESPSFEDILFGATHPSKAYIQSVSDYLTEKSDGLEFSNWTAESKAIDLIENEYNAYADPISSKTGKAACVVIPMNPDANAQIFMSYNLGINSKDIKQLGNNPKNNNFSYKQLSNFINYHEASHCLDLDNGNNSIEDNKFEDKFSHFHTGYSPLDNLNHEIFADIRASLMLAQDGDKDAASKLADMRMASLISNKDLAHYSTDALQTTANFIQKTSLQDLQKMDTVALTQKALKISQESRLSVAEYKFLDRVINGKIKTIPANMDDFYQNFKARKNKILSRIIGDTEETFLKAAENYAKTQEKLTQKSEKTPLNLITDIAKTHYKNKQISKKSINKDFDLENFRSTIKNSKDTLRARKNAINISEKKSHITSKNSQNFSNMLKNHKNLKQVIKTIKKMHLNKKSL